MKIYYQDHGYRGIIFVVADDEVHARNIMSTVGCYNYEPNETVYEEEIVSGLMIQNLGDS